MHKTGHTGMALCWVLPVTLAAWVLSGPLLAGISIAAALAVSSLPDRIDFAFESVLTHRGGTHTIWFGAGVALTGAALGYAIGTIALKGAVSSGLSVYLPEEILASVNAFSLALTIWYSIFLSICSHLFADSLTIGRGSNIIRPLWPLTHEPLYFGYTRADSQVWNGGLLAIGLIAQSAVLGALAIA
jgi:inner membrane protein